MQGSPPPGWAGAPLCGALGAAAGSRGTLGKAVLLGEGGFHGPGPQRADAGHALHVPYSVHCKAVM